MSMDLGFISPQSTWTKLIEPKLTEPKSTYSKSHELRLY